MDEILSALPLTFIPLFVAVDVFWVVPYFVKSVEGFDDTRTIHLARLAVLTAMLVGLGFLLVGKVILSVLGITVNDFKIAGGLLLFILALEDLFRGERGPGNIEDDLSAVVPIGVPLIVGPAVLTTMLMLVEQHGALPTLVGFLLNLLICYVLLAGSRRLVKYVRRELLAALSKIMAILLASIAVMMVRMGIQGLLV